MGYINVCVQMFPFSLLLLDQLSVLQCLVVGHLLEITTAVKVCHLADRVHEWCSFLRQTLFLMFCQERKTANVSHLTYWPACWPAKNVQSSTASGFVLNLFRCFCLKLPLSTGTITPLIRLHSVEPWGLSKVASFQDSIKTSPCQKWGPSARNRTGRRDAKKQVTEFTPVAPSNSWTPDLWATQPCLGVYVWGCNTLV